MIGDFLFLILLVFIAGSIGGVVWAKSTGKYPVQWQWPSLALPLGLGLMGLLLGFSASAGVFSFGLGLILFFGLLAFIICLTELPRNKRFQPGDFHLISRESISIWLLVLMIASVWPGIQVPVTDGDALCYHLEVAKRIAQSNTVSFDPDLHETAYPLLVESIQAAALKLRGPVATRAISFLFGISLAASGISLAIPLAGKRNAIWAGVILLSLPIVNCGMIAPLNDVPLAALCAAALVALDTKEISFQKRCVLSGLFCGLACGVKFPGIVWSGVMGLLIVLEGWQNSKPSIKSISIHNAISIVKPASFFLVVLVASGIFWYARSAVLTGNPVHPYFRNTFGGHGLDEVLEDARKTPFQHIWNIATAPVGMSLFPSHFDSFSHQVGPVFLAIVPLGFLRKKPPQWYLLLALGWLEMAICLTQRQSPRFYIAAFVPWSAAAATVLGEWLSIENGSLQKRNRSTVLTVCLGILIITSLFNLARVRHGAAILAGLESPSKYLVDTEPTARLAGWTDQNLPAEARLVGQDHRGFYWPRPFTMEKAHRRLTNLLKIAPTPELTIKHFQEAGFTHLVMAEPDPIDAVEFDTDLSIHLASWTALQKPLLDQTIHEIDGYNRRYRIYALYTDSTILKNENIANQKIKTDPMLQPASNENRP